MTSVKAFTPWELLHEFDTAIMSPEDVSTFGNIGEVWWLSYLSYHVPNKSTILFDQVLPEVITPLTQSTFGRVLEKNMCKNVLRRDSSPFYASICRISHYRMAFEVYNMFLQAVEKDITLENRMYGLIVFGHDFISDDIHRIALKRNGVATTRKTLPIMWDVLKVNILDSENTQLFQNWIHLIYDFFFYQFAVSVRQSSQMWWFAEIHRSICRHLWPIQFEKIPHCTGIVHRSESKGPSNGVSGHSAWFYIEDELRLSDHRVNDFGRE